MHEFWSTVEQHWNHNRVLAWALVLFGIAIGVWVVVWPQSPGVSIGILALAAGIMSVRPEMHPAEKLAWVVLLIIFAVCEVRAIGRSDTANENVRDQQNREFQSIAEGLKTSIETSKTQYDSTIEHVNGVLTTTQTVAALANKNLLFVTGGKSFAYLIPSTSIGPNFNQTSGFSLNLVNDGNEMLTGVSTFVALVLKEGNKDDDGAVFDFGPMNQVSIGSLGAHDIRLVPSLGIDPTSFFAQNNSGHYFAQVFAQNGIVQEDIYFRLAKSGVGWAYRIEVRGKRNHKQIVLKSIDWTEPQTASR